MPFPLYRQHDAMDCGPTCLRMVAKYHGRSYSLDYLRRRCFITREGVSMLGISDAAEHIGMRTLSVSVPFKTLVEEVPLPCIAHWQQNHFVVVYEAKRGKVYVADPAHGKVVYKDVEFKKAWLSKVGERGNEDSGFLLLMEPTPEFKEKNLDDEKAKKGFGHFLGYLFRFKQLLVQLGVGFLVASILQLIFPFLTQSVVDIGIGNRDINFVYIILAAQLMLFFSQMAVELIRSWILLHVGSRISINIISDFLIKLMKLPLPYFDTKTVGDTMQRIGDHERVENFLTATTLNVLFSMFSFVIFGIVLLYYNAIILLVFMGFSIASVIWILIFLRARRNLDYKNFALRSGQQDNLVQLVSGIQEIKLQGVEKQKRWSWERLQAREYKLRIKGLSLSQYQTVGSSFFNQGKNIIITFLAAKAVIDGSMTLGMMMAVQYIVGQLNAPIEQLISFIHSAQDAKLSLERMQEIHGEEEDSDYTEEKSTIFPKGKSLEIKDLTFQYSGPRSPKVLENLTMSIPEGKTTAIVGSSGSGKTTLLKLLLAFYEPTEGEVLLGGVPLHIFDSRVWRERCGVVMQDGFIFSDTVARNISCTTSDEKLDRERLIQAAEIANLREDIEDLPLAYNTKIGSDGQALSGGQRQRVLIARAVYKNPDYLFFDEATSALDANNEKAIVENLNQFIVGRTAVVIAHRLSTVKNADQIVVLDKGRVVEQGNHEELTAKRGAYYHLVKNQLELGS